MHRTTDFSKDDNFNNEQIESERWLLLFWKEKWKRVCVSATIVKWEETKGG